MKAQAIKQGRVFVLGAALLAALVYSVLALTIAVKPAYASSCNCDEEFLEGDSFCQTRGGIWQFNCPVLGSPNGPAWYVLCNYGGGTGEYCSGT